MVGLVVDSSSSRHTSSSSSSSPLPPPTTTTSTATTTSSMHVMHFYPEFECPIGQEIMEDPVIGADGYTYDRINIEDWFQKHNTSPMTGEVLASLVLIPNRVLKSVIREYLESNGTGK